MNTHLKIVCGIWGMFLVLELWLAFELVGVFENGMTFLCLFSYLFGFGYFLSAHIGMDWVGPMPISDWRWILGALTMLAVSVPPILVRKSYVRVVGYVILIVVHLLSFGSLVVNMCGAIT